MFIKNNLKNILESKGLSFEELAANVDIPYNFLKDIYLCNKELTQDALQILSEYLKIREIDFLPNRKKEVYKNIGIQLRQAREEKHLTLIELGKMSGVSYTHISEIERGKTCASLKTLEKLAKVLEIPTKSFFQLDEKMTLGEKIRRLRERFNLTQVQLAEKTGVSLSLIGQIETGRIKPALATLENISYFFGVDISYFLLSELEEQKVKQKIVDISDRVEGNLNNHVKELKGKDLELLRDIINVLKTHGRYGSQEKELDSKMDEMLTIMRDLSEDDKEFVLENARWLLKKSKGN